MNKIVKGDDQPKLQVRYGNAYSSANDKPWRDCLAADLTEGCLAIQWDRDTLEWIPLHVIRGEIQVRKWIDPAAAPSGSESAA